MATSTHWRARFVLRALNSNQSMKVETCHPRTLDGSELAGLVGVTGSPLHDTSTFPAANVMDGNPDTYAFMIWNGSNVDGILEWEYSSAVEVGQFELRCTDVDHPTIPDHNCKDFTEFFVIIEQSPDGGTSWVPVSWFGDAPPPADKTSYLSLDLLASNFNWPPASSLGGAGGIFGIVTEDSTPASGYPVALLDRETLKRVGYTLSESDGGYAFNGINPYKEYVVIGLDPTLADAKNAIAWDHIVPINARSIYDEGSAFVARRLRDPDCGAIVGLEEVAAGTYNHIKGNVFGGYRNVLKNDEPFWDYDLPVRASPDGVFSYVTPAGTTADNMAGLLFQTNRLIFGSNDPADTINYGELSFEFIFVPPSTGEDPLVMSWGGADSTSGKGPINQLTADGTIDTEVHSRGNAFFSLEVTDTDINVRVGLGTNNRDTVRATTPVVVGAAQHVIVTYDMDDEIKLYLNGVLKDTTAIGATGRPYANMLWMNATNPTSANRVDYWVNTGTQYLGWNGLISHVSDFFVTGVGHTQNALYAYTASGPRFDGEFGMSGVYGRVFDQADVDDFYDSFANPSTHTVPIANSGYVAEVEADNPFLYMRGNELGSVTFMGILVGDKSQAWELRGTPTFGGTGFTATGGSVAFAGNEGLLGLHVRGMPATFSVEFCVRVATLPAAEEAIFSSRSTDDVRGSEFNPVGINITGAGALKLVLADRDANVSEFSTADAAITAATDHHIVVTHDQWVTQEVHIYVDGVEVLDAVAGIVPAVEQIWRMTWGCEHNDSNNDTSFEATRSFNGELAEMALYGFALSPTRIAAHAAAL